MSFLATIIQAIRQIRQGQQAEIISEYNAQVAEQEAKAIETSGKFEQFKLRREKRRMISRQKALYAKAGVRLWEGSPLDVMAETAAEYEMDLAANRYNTQVGISRALSTATGERLKGRYAKRASYWGAVGTILTLPSGGTSGSTSGGTSGGTVSASKSYSGQYISSTKWSHIGR